MYGFFGAPVLAVMEVPPDSISSYGAIDAEPVAHNGSSDRVYRIRNLVEKPKPEDAPSNLAIIGRYVLTPEIFESLQAIDPGSGGEIQLTDALRHLLHRRPIYAVPIRRHALRRGRQAGIPESHRGIRPAAARPGRDVPGVPEGSEAVRILRIVGPRSERQPNCIKELVKVLLFPFGRYSCLHSIRVPPRLPKTTCHPSYRRDREGTRPARGEPIGHWSSVLRSH